MAAKIAQCSSWIASEKLAARYEQLFDDVPINIAYLSLTRGSRFERDGRMVIWGVTGKEGDQMCEILKQVYEFAIQVRSAAWLRVDGL